MISNIIEEIPPLKEWAGENLKSKVQVLIMTSSSHHAVEAHRDGDDITAQFSICHGNYRDLLTGNKNRGTDRDWDITTDVKTN